MYKEEIIKYAEGRVYVWANVGYGSGPQTFNSEEPEAWS